ncbi:MAG TPA: hypothetical protein VIM50_05160 [Candidatus Limnocylindria bacterium]|jgi:hypothetical protein
MVEDRISWDDVRTIERWPDQAAPGERVRRPTDVYEEWLAATKVAYTQGG